MTNIYTQIEGCLTVYLPHEIIWNANLMQQGNFIDVFLARHFFGYIRPSSGAWDVELQHMVLCTEFLDGWWSWEPLRRSCVRCGWCRARHGIICTVNMTYAAALKNTTHPKTRCRKHMLQLNISCSWWWAYVPETCRAKNTSIKLPCCIKLAFQIISSLRNEYGVS